MESVRMIMMMIICQGISHILVPTLFFQCLISLKISPFAKAAKNSLSHTSITTPFSSFLRLKKSTMPPKKVHVIVVRLPLKVTKISNIGK